jgi:hypothetical protein
MTDRASTEFLLSPTPSGELDAKEAISRILTDESAVLRDRAMLLISELLASGEDVRASGDNRISVKVLSATRSIRVEIRDEGTGVVLGGLRRHQGPSSHGRGSHGWSTHLLSRVADRWGLVSDADGAWVWFELDVPQGE